MPRPLRTKPRLVFMTKPRLLNISRPRMRKDTFFRHTARRLSSSPSTRAPRLLCTRACLWGRGLGRWVTILTHIHVHVRARTHMHARVHIHTYTESNNRSLYGCGTSKIRYTLSVSALFQVDESTKKLDEETSDFFHCTVARFLYAAKRARPHIQVAVAFLCKRVKDPTIQDWKKLGRLVRYV